MATKTRPQWVTEIRRFEQKTVESLIELGKALLKAKADLGHGEFGELLKDLKMHSRLAQRLMALSRNPRFVNPTNLSHLPLTLSAFSELANLSETSTQASETARSAHPRRRAPPDNTAQSSRSQNLPSLLPALFRRRTSRRQRPAALSLRSL